MRATQTLGLLVPDVTDPLHGQIIAGFEQEAAVRGYSVSIANGLAFGFTSYALLRILRGEFRKTHWLVYVLAAMFILRFIYLSRAG